MPQNSTLSVVHDSRHSLLLALAWAYNYKYKAIFRFGTGPVPRKAGRTVIHQVKARLSQECGLLRDIPRNMCPDVYMTPHLRNYVIWRTCCLTKWSFPLHFPPFLDFVAKMDAQADEDFSWRSPNNLTLCTPWSWQKYCLNHCARTCCSLRNVTRCRFTNWRIRCEQRGRNVHFS